MIRKALFPYAVAISLTLSMSISVVAQSGETRARQLNQAEKIGEAEQIALHNDEAIIVSTASPEDIKAAKPLTIGGGANFRFQQLMSAAIDERLGARYRWGAEGPSAYDCSGFVWSIFQSAGINFERISARAMWTRFPAPTEEQKYQLGTLVFFRNLGHVGVVVNEHGFYHASRRQGVIYSPFNEYWLSRLDGFRRVPTITGESD